MIRLLISLFSFWKKAIPKNKKEVEDPLYYFSWNSLIFCGRPFHFYWDKYANKVDPKMRYYIDHNDVAMPHIFGALFAVFNEEDTTVIYENNNIFINTNRVMDFKELQDKLLRAYNLVHEGKTIFGNDN